MKIFFILPVKGQINGAKFLSLKIIQHLNAPNLILIDTAQASNSENFGTFSLKKIVSGVALLVKATYTVNFHSVCYLNLTPHGFAFYRDLCLLIILKLKFCNITVHLHANGLENKNSLLLRTALKNVKIIVLNNYQKNQVSFLNSSIFVLGNTLPLIKEISFEDIWKVRRRDILLYFSNISEEKGIFEAIAYYKAIKEQIPNIRLRIAGAFLDEYSKTFIKRLTSEDQSVEYVGFINSHEQKCKIFSESSLLLFMSKPFYEGYPLVYIEALMFGLPILTTPQHVAENIIAKENGFIAAKLDSSVINKVVDLLKNTRKHKDASRYSYELYQEKYKFELYMKNFKEILFKSS